MIAMTSIGCVSQDFIADDDDSATVDEREQSWLLAPSVITDQFLVASNAGYPLPGPYNYQLLGYWDVDRGGAHGTESTTGSYIIALYAEKKTLDQTTTCVEDILIRASNLGTLPSSMYPSWILRGYWDVDRGGAVGTGNLSSGAYMTGLYHKSGSTANGMCVSDVQLRASNENPGICLPNYGCQGWWDVDAGGGYSTDNSSGTYMMSLNMLR